MPFIFYIDVQYSCTADNGFHATPVTKTVDVKVAYPPSIQIEEAFIVSDMAEEQVSCQLQDLLNSKLHSCYCSSVLYCLRYFRSTIKRMLLYIICYISDFVDVDLAI